MTATVSAMAMPNWTDAKSAQAAIQAWWSMLPRIATVTVMDRLWSMTVACASEAGLEWKAPVRLTALACTAAMPWRMNAARAIRILATIASRIAMVNGAVQPRWTAATFAQAVARPWWLRPPKTVLGYVVVWPLRIV